jgi:hypothetical protein
MAALTFAGSMILLLLLAVGGLGLLFGYFRFTEWRKWRQVERKHR